MGRIKQGISTRPRNNPIAGGDEIIINFKRIKGKRQKHTHGVIQLIRMEFFT